MRFYTIVRAPGGRYTIIHSTLPHSLIVFVAVTMRSFSITACCLAAAFADDAVHCIHLDDFDCYSRNGECFLFSVLIDV